MKNLILLNCLMVLFLASACNKDDDDSNTNAIEYHIHIDDPNSDDKHVGDVLPINITFEEHDGNTVHHVKIRIYNADDNTNVVYNKPDDAHVHETDGQFEYTDNFTLNVDPHTDWVLEAKVWGHEDGVSEMVKTVPFHVHP